MRNKLKLLLILSVIGLILIGFTGCKDGGTEAPSNTVDNNVIYSPYVKTTLVMGDGVEERDVVDIRTAYYKAVGKEIAVIGAGGSSSEHEIIIGRTNRTLSEKAYRYLSRFKSDDDFVGYVIYSDGISCAIAFDEASFGENVAFKEAVGTFVSKYMIDSSLKLDSGAVFSDSFDSIVKQHEIDEANTERLWELKLSQILSKVNGEEKAANILAELKAIRHIFNYDYNTVKWLANLYDPVTGGFYYSNSARNNDGFLPDLESTAQALGIVESILTGYGGTLTDYFGEEIAAKFVSFANNMQQENGYFYHPQWSKDEIDKNLNRRSRDVLAALNILECFDASPIYDVNGVKGSGRVTQASKLLFPLSLSKAEATAQLVDSANEELYIPSYLRGEEEFESYLSNFNISSNTAEVCETLYSEFSLYEAVDEMLEENGENYRLKDILVSYLAQNQNKYTGLWCPNGTVSYDEIGELCSIVKLYNESGEMLPNYQEILKSIERGLEFEEEPDNITDISGVWLALSDVVINITAYSGEYNRYEVNGYLSSLYRSFEKKLKITRENLLLFLRDDGSFSTTLGGSLSEQFGMSVAVPLMEEGDMNATLLAVKSTYLSIFNVLGLGSVPIFNPSDKMMFQKTLLDMGVIIKNEIKEIEPEGFEGYNVGDVPDIKYAFSSDKSFMKVVPGPEKQGNVLELYTPDSGGLSQYFFDIISSVKNASCYAYELDMCVLPESGTDAFAHLYIYQDTYMIALNRNGDTISFFEETSRAGNSSYSQDLGIRAEVGEWFNLRVEYYPGSADTVRIKIFFNGKCIAATDNYFGNYKESSVPSLEYRYFAIYGNINNNTMNVLVDNIITEKSYGTYKPEISPYLNKNIDSPDKVQTVYDFEGSADGSAPSAFKPVGDSSAVTVITDSDNNKWLSISQNAGKIILPLDQRGAGANSSLIEFDIIIDENSQSGAKYQINFNEYLYKERNFAAMQLIVSEEDGRRFATLAEVVSGSTGNVYSDYKLYAGEKYHISLRLFFEEEVLVVFVNEEMAGISENVIEGCKRFYMGEVTIQSLTQGKASTILIDNFVSERVAGNFEETTAPAVDRVTEGFDNADDLELFGVTPSGGVLSFAYAQNGAYVKIPVNVRVDKPNLALVGFDIANTESASGSLIVSLRDGDDNIISEFELVAGTSGIDIYEHTINGRYNAPIHTVNSTAFNFSVEYSAEKECYNLLVDGDYVASSSLTYTQDSGRYDFVCLCVSAESPANISVDNLYAEKLFGVFRVHEVSMENTDKKDGTLTFETSSFASMPSPIEIHIGTAGSHALIREGKIGEAVSKVLELNAVKAAGANALVFKNLKKDDSKNSVYFETDMMMQSTDGIANIVMSFRSLPDLAYNFVLQSSESGGNIKALGAEGRDFAKTLDIKDGEWFKLRLEYRDTPHDFDYDGSNDCLFRFYINGKLLGEGHTPRTIGSLQTTESIYAIRITAEWQTAGRYYFDNVTFGQCNMVYEEPIPADTDTITYRPGVITNMTEPVIGSGSAVKISEMSVYGQVSKVLEFYSAKNNQDKLTIKPTLTLDVANAISFETDIMIEPESNTSTFYLEPQNNKGKFPFRLTIKAAKDGNVTISTADIPETVIGESGEWIHLKIEYMNPGFDYNGDRMKDILVKVYADDMDSPLAIGHKPYNASSYFDPLDLGKYVFTADKASVAKIFLDNTRFWQVELTPDKAPEFDYTEDFVIGGGGFADDGWTD